MKIAVIDDRESCREEIKNYFSRYLTEQCGGEKIQAEDFISGEDFLYRFIPNSYDIIFIAQFMSGMTGIETAREIRKRDALVSLIFVTTSRDFAIDSYGVQACGYLVKPYTYQDFINTLNAARIEKIRRARFIRIEQDSVLLREILWCDSDGHYSRIHSDRKGLIRYRLTFAELAEKLSAYPQFLTCYKGCIINLERTDRMNDQNFVLDDGTPIPFAKRERKKLAAAYHQYLFQREREDDLL